jgi:hypothetical protein
VKRLIDFFFGRKLRNRKNGMAWIQGINDNAPVPGAVVLNGRAVKTVKVIPEGKWQIEPPQRFTPTADFIWAGYLFRAGHPVTVTAIADECLQPWKPDGVKAKDVKELFAPQLPAFSTGGYVNPKEVPHVH